MSSPPPTFVLAAPSPSLSRRKKLVVPPTLDVSADWLQPELKKQQDQTRSCKEKTATWGTRGQFQRCHAIWRGQCHLGLTAWTIFKPRPSHIQVLSVFQRALQSWTMTLFHLTRL